MQLAGQNLGLFSSVRFSLSTVVYYESYTKGPHMLLSRSPSFIAVALIGLTFRLTASAAVAQERQREQPAERISTQDIPPANCRVTLPENGSFTPPAPLPSDPNSEPLSWGAPTGSKLFWFGTAKLWTVLPTDGIWRALTFSAEGDYAYLTNSRGSIRLFPRIVGRLRLPGKGSTAPRPLSQRTTRSTDGAEAKRALKV